MKNLYNGLIAVFALSAVVLYSCNKSVNSGNAPASSFATAPGLHAYGLLPMTPDQWASVPVFSKSVLSNGGLQFPVPANLATSYLLASPAVRDQGQIGSCTGFCGTEANEILNYYISNSSTSGGFSSASSSALLTATQTQFVNSSLFGPSSELSPLFLYYVERCVILKGSISTDGGAYMVDIPEAFQGLSSNSGTGKTLTGTISGKTYSFAGESYENLYPYPSNGSDKSTQYKTAPSAGSISNALSFTIGVQSGATGSSSSSSYPSHGYYVINSSDPVTDAKTAIFYNKPVMMGFNVYDNSKYQYFEGLGVAGYSPNNYTYNPLTSSGSLVSGLRLLGGHAVPLIGYIDDASQPGGGVFICENSWNTTWGYQGYFFLPYSVLRSTKIVPAGNLYVAII